MEASISPSLIPTTAATATPTLSTPPQSQPTPPPSSSSSFTFPPHHSFPPFYTLQPNSQTLSRQLSLWSSLILSYCSAHSLFTLTLSSAPSLPLFSNPGIRRALDERSIKTILTHMSLPENGRRVEFLPSSSTSTSTTSTSLSAFGRGGERERERTQGSAAWIWFRTPEDWGEEIANWVDGTGQKGQVLTVYELREGEAVAKQGWVGMDEGMLRRCLESLVRKGRAQVFEGGGGDGAGVKFF